MGHRVGVPTRLMATPTHGWPYASTTAQCWQPRSRAGSRLKQISKHIDSKPFLELNTPFSTERTARIEDEQGNRILPDKVEQAKLKEAKQEFKREVEEVKKLAPEPPKNMSSQAPHPALLIPGPIEFDDAVLSSMSHYR